MSHGEKILATDAKLNLTSEDIRWGTPEVVARYRAERLKCKKIVDLCCGVGAQSFAFAKTCEKVIAIDIDSEKIERAKENAKILNIKNIEFHVGDILEPHTITLAKGADIIFCDPERLETESERTIESIMPNIAELLESYFPITKNIALELPPQIKLIPYDCEWEYISVNGSLNRLTVYMGKLKTAEKRAVILPQNITFAGETKNILPTIQTEPPKTYLLEVDPAIIKANLLYLLAKETETTPVIYEKNIYFTSEKPSKSPFFKNQYKVLQTLKWDYAAIKLKLHSLDAKQVTLRYKISPEKYWKERAYFEKGLQGERIVQLFKYQDQAIIAEKI